MILTSDAKSSAKGAASVPAAENIVQPSGLHISTILQGDKESVATAVQLKSYVNKAFEGRH